MVPETDETVLKLLADYSLTALPAQNEEKALCFFWECLRLRDWTCASSFTKFWRYLLLEQGSARLNKFRKKHREVPFMLLRNHFFWRACKMPPWSQLCNELNEFFRSARFSNPLIDNQTYYLKIIKEDKLMVKLNDTQEARSHETATISFDWAYLNDDQMVDNFRDFLKTSRPIKYVSKVGKSPDLRAWISWISALRLSRNYPAAAGQIWPKIRGAYASPLDLPEAVKEGIHLLRSLFPEDLFPVDHSFPNSDWDKKPNARALNRLAKSILRLVAKYDHPDEQEAILEGAADSLAIREVDGEIDCGNLMRLEHLFSLFTQLESDGNIPTGEVGQSLSIYISRLVENPEKLRNKSITGSKKAKSKIVRIRKQPKKKTSRR